MRPTDQGSHAKPAGTTGHDPSQSSLGRYAACYALYLVVIAGCYLNFVVWNNAVQLAAFAIVGRELSLEASYAFPMFIIICVLFGVAIWAEHSLRTAVARGELRSAFTRIVLRLGGAAVVAIVISEVAGRLARG